MPSYTASKSGVMGITRLMANGWAQHKINVNADCPGYMATNNTAQLRQDENHQLSIPTIPPAAGAARGPGRPVVFLALAGVGLRQWLHRGRGWRLARTLNIAHESATERQFNFVTTADPDTRGARDGSRP